MTTVARTFSSTDAQFYLPDGKPLYEVPYKDPSNGMRKANLSDARKLGAMPGPTAVLRCLAKPELQNWITEQAVLAVLTTPRKKDPTTGEFETDDAFVHRVLHIEKIQDEERDIAAILGKKIHQGCADYFMGQEVDPDIRPWIDPAVKELCKRGQLVCAEKILIGKGYGGRTDLILESPECFWMVDYKGTKKLPEKGAWTEHVLQLSAYAAAFQSKTNGQIDKPIRCTNVYISTIEKGKFAIWDHDPDWQKAFNMGFYPLLKVWCFVNQYWPPGLQ